MQKNASICEVKESDDFVFTHTMLTFRFYLSRILTYNSHFALEGWEKDKYSSDIRASLQNFDKLYDRLIAYLIFEIDINTWRNYLKIQLENFNQIVAIVASQITDYVLTV